MYKNSALTVLVFITVIAVARSQYFDIFQGLQQLLQANQQNDYNTFSTFPRSQQRQDNKKKMDRSNERSTKKPPVNQYDYIFATTQKPKRKQMKNSSQSNPRSLIKNQYSNILFGDYFPNYEVTTKRARTKMTTTEANFYSNVNFRPATDYNNYRPMEIYDSNRGTNFNRRTEVNSDFIYNSNPSLGNNNSNRNFNSNVNNNNREFMNTNSNNNRDFINTNANNNRNINSNNRDFMNTNSNNNRNMNSNNRDFTNSNANNNRHMNNNNRDFINTDYNPEQNYDPVLPNFGFTNGFNTGSNTRNPNVSFQRPIAGISQIDYDRPTHKGMDLNSRVNGNSFVYPTDNPLLNRPGVKPVYEVGQPITNKPIRNNNDVFGTGNIPGNDYGATSKPDNGYGGTESAFGNDQPEIVLGVDEEDMTERQKRRYIDLAEKMCDRYKALTIKKVVALPLLPSPDPVELNVSSCTPINVPLVIGGKVVTIKEFPHMALVGWMKTRNTGYSWKCGGSLISDRFVLTAGHCTFHDRDFDVVSGPPQAVQLGSSYLDDPSAVVIKIEEVIRHPKYKMRRSYHDVALLKLKQKVTFSDVIRPACLGEAPREGENIIATGWGRTEFGGDHSEQLRSVSIPVWNMQECREIWGTSLKLPDGPRPDSHICAGEKRGGKDTCQGDSGGPIVRASGCAWRVVGVTSVGRACGAAHTPALYATVPRAFISATVFGN